MDADIQARDIERLLSLPAWKKRYELYGVWVATEVAQALKDHEIVINHSNAELKFAFREARILDLKSARPKRGSGAFPDRGGGTHGNQAE